MIYEIKLILKSKYSGWSLVWSNESVNVYKLVLISLNMWKDKTDRREQLDVRIF